MSMSVQQRKYKSILVRIISYLDGVVYDMDAEFSKKRLNELQTKDLKLG